jgi:glycosyltransferase involved in cell wall biosynthesis
MEAHFIALLGRADAPTDGVADYCGFLAEAFRRRSVSLQTVRVPWAERGWGPALRWLSRESADWKDGWVLLQYTALSWSRRGFPFGVLRVLRLLRKRGVRCTVVFHDGTAHAGTRMRDELRRAAQSWTLRQLFEQAARSVLTTPPGTLDWLPSMRAQAAFIPIGANIPECGARRAFDTGRRPKTVAVFSVTGGDARVREVEDIAFAVRRAEQRVGRIRLEVFGRGAAEARPVLEKALDGARVDLRVRGVIPAEEITRTLAASDASLCVRGQTTSHRGTSIAGISCGVPVVGFGKPGNDPAIDAAGVRLAPWHEPSALADALVEVLTDASLWQQLHERNLQAHRRYFSWDAVAERYLELHAASVDQRA